MTISLFIAQSGEGITKIGKKISEYKLNLQDYKQHYSSLVEVYNQFISIVSIYLSASESKTSEEDTQRKIKRCEIRALEIYVNFKRNIVYNRTIKDFFMYWKNYWNKDSDYQRLNREIRMLQSELRNITGMSIDEHLEKLKLLSEKYDQLEVQKVINDPTLFWTAVGAIAAILYLLNS